MVKLPPKRGKQRFLLSRGCKTPLHPDSRHGAQQRLAWRCLATPAALTPPLSWASQDPEAHSSPLPGPDGFLLNQEAVVEVLGSAFLWKTWHCQTCSPRAAWLSAWGGRCRLSIEHLQALCDLISSMPRWDWQGRPPKCQQPRHFGAQGSRLPHLHEKGTYVAWAGQQGAFAL